MSSPTIIDRRWHDGEWHFEVQPSGVCSRQIEIILHQPGLPNDTSWYIRSVIYFGGCSGNTQGIGHLVSDMRVTDVISRLSGIQCGYKGTSCPDQLAQALNIILRELRVEL